MSNEIHHCKDCEFSGFCAVRMDGGKALYPYDGICKYFTEARRPGNGAKKDRQTER